VVRWSGVNRKWVSSYILLRLVQTHTEKMSVLCCTASNSVTQLDHAALQILLSCL
jgi:hypothetical protein